MKRNDLISDLDIIEFRHWILEQFLALQRAREHRVTEGVIRLFESSLGRAQKIGLKGIGYLFGLLLPQMRRANQHGSLSVTQFETLLSWSDQVLSLAHGQLRAEQAEPLIDELIAAGLIEPLPEAFAQLILERLKADANLTHEWVLVLSEQAAKQHRLVLAVDECALLAAALSETHFAVSSGRRASLETGLSQAKSAVELLDLKEFGVLFDQWSQWALKVTSSDDEILLQSSAAAWQGFFSKPGLLSGLVLLDANGQIANPLVLANARRQLNQLQVIQTRLRSVNNEQLAGVGLHKPVAAQLKQTAGIQVQRDICFELQTLGRQIKRELQRPTSRPQELIRLVHTLKASAQMIAQESLAQDAHLLEDALLASDAVLSVQLKEALTRHADCAEQVSLPAAVQMHVTPHEDSQQIAQMALSVAQSPWVMRSKASLEAKEHRSSLLQLAQLASTSSIERLEKRLVAVVEHASAACGKTIQFRFEAPNLRIGLATIAALEVSLTHLLRNSVDHGIEQPEIRAAGRKSAVGRITVIVNRDADQLLVQCIDDGQGISPAIEPTLFTDGVSSTAQVNPMSGRGLGMGIALQSVEQVGGSIRLIKNQRGEGCVFLLKVPQLNTVTHWTSLELGRYWIGFDSASVKAIEQAADWGVFEAIKTVAWQGKQLPVVSLPSWFAAHFGKEGVGELNRGALSSIWHIQQGQGSNQVEFLLLAPPPSYSGLVMLQTPPSSAALHPLVAAVAALDDGQVAMGFELSSLVG